MAEPTIGNWTKAQLNKFIQNAIATEPIQFPKSLTVTTLHVTGKLYVDGDIQFSPQASTVVHNA